MKKFLLLLGLLWFWNWSYGAFSDDFYEKTLRFDFYRTGNDTADIISLDEMVEEPFWAGSMVNLIDTFQYGYFKYEVFDAVSGTLLYSRGYNSLFDEWRFTPEAKLTWRTFSESALIPYPKRKVKIDFSSRSRAGIWKKTFSYIIDPNSIFIRKGLRYNFKVNEIHKAAIPSKALDIVFLAEGYTQAEMQKFRNDCQRMMKYLFECEPFNRLKNKINIRAVEVPSPESGTDLPGKKIWKNTFFNSHFYTFGTDRYLTCEDNKILREVAGQVPYDQMILLVNTNIYGGGGFYNYCTILAVDDYSSNFLLIHEFGHSLAGLADEYYDSEVAVVNYYPKGFEPWEPNITTLVAFEKKWKDMLPSNLPIPTPEIPEYMNITGVFEGAGYKQKGVYRPRISCTMKDVRYNAFCPVCQRAIERIVLFYSD